MLFEQICYHFGGVLADMTIVALSGAGTFKVASRISNFASKHKIESSDIEAVSDNLLDCLEYLD